MLNTHIILILNVVMDDALVGHKIWGENLSKPTRTNAPITWLD
jgi:hypothetical protein